MGTTAKGYPYPEPTDPIAAGADAIKALAQAVNDRLSTRIQAGGLNIPAAGSVVLTFPTPFTSPPWVFATLRTTAASGRIVMVGTASNTAVTFYCQTAAGANAAADINWLAIQP